MFVRIITGPKAYDLERNINKYLLEEKRSELVDIKYAGRSSDAGYHYSALLLMKEK